MLDLDFIYLLLNFILLFTFAYSGYVVYKSGQFNNCIFWCVIMFTFVLGARYDRGIDYATYSYRFNHKVLYDNNPFFDTLNRLLAILGFDEYTVFFAYAFLFSICGMFFLKDHQRKALWLFPSFLIAFIAFEESFPRQALSYSFCFLFFKYFFRINTSRYSLDRNMIKCILFAMLCIFIHTANIITIIFCVVFVAFVRKPLHYKYTVSVYLITYLLSSYVNFDFLQNTLSNIYQYIPSSDVSDNYMGKMDIWLSNDVQRSKYSRNLISFMLEMIGNSLLLVLGYKTAAFSTKREDHVICSAFLNMFFVGILFIALFPNLEILRRIGIVLGYSWFLVWAFVLYYRPYRLSSVQRIAYLLCSFWFSYDYIRYLIAPGFGTLFIWDK